MYIKSFSCKSFTENDKEYILKIENNRLCFCSCPDLSKICKHMLLVNRITNVPLAVRVFLQPSPETLLIDNNSTNDTEQQQALLKAEYLESINKYYNMFNKKFPKKIHDIKDNIDHLNEMEDTLKKLNSIIDSIGVAPQTSAPKQK